ncbi:MAG: hypothetical protein ACI959_001902 [Limisphaerales bacterium]|jgi:hypothetical protein
MKKFLSLLSLTLLIGMIASGSLFAQSEHNEMAEKITKQYVEAIEMTEDQSIQAKGIFTDHLKAAQDNWAAADGNKETFKTSQTATFKATDAKIKALLTDDQLAVYETKKQDLKKRVLEHYMQNMME